MYSYYIYIYTCLINKLFVCVCVFKNEYYLFIVLLLLNIKYYNLMYRFVNYKNMYIR